MPARMNRYLSVHPRSLGCPTQYRCYFVVISIVIIIIAIGVLPSFLRLQLPLLLPLLVLLRLPQPLALGVIHRPHNRIPRQWCQVIHEDEVPRLVLPLLKLVSRGQEIN